MSEMSTHPESVESVIVRQQRPRDFFAEDEIQQLRELSDSRAWWSVVHCWAVIFGTWIAVSLWTNPVTILLGVVIIGARQLGLAVLSHDAAHFTLFRNRKLNDWVAEWILSRPLTGGSVYSYRKYHLQHHAHTQQPEDPDLHLSKPFPISQTSWRRKVWRDLSGQTGWKQYSAMFSAPMKGDSRIQRWQGFWRKFGPNVLINLCFLAGFTLAGQWYLYFLLWWLPALTWNRFITRLRNIGEHAAVPDNDDRLRNTRTITAAWWERAFIAPYGVNYHLEHHLIVNSPWYRLKDAHKLLVQKGFADRMELRSSYWDMLAVAIKG